jgi:hypothetical protein
MNGISTMRFPLDKSMCSTSVPILVEYGRSPELFVGVIAVGMESCAERGTQEENRRKRTN